jgi:hypothetical protein
MLKISAFKIMKITKSIVTNYSFYPYDLEIYFEVPESLSDVSL